MTVNLAIKKTPHGIEIDDPGRPGTPPVGRGKTLKEALGDFLLNNQNALGIESLKADPSDEVSMAFMRDWNQRHFRSKR